MLGLHYGIKKTCWERKSHSAMLDTLQFLNNISCIYFDPKYMFAEKLVEMAVVQSLTRAKYSIKTVLFL